MTKPKLYGVYTACFPFLEKNESKIRPVIIVSAPYGEHNIVAIVPISSKLKREVVDSNLRDWQAEGLLRASVARVHRLTTMLSSDLLAELGELTAADKAALRKSLGELLELDVEAQP